MRWVLPVVTTTVSLTFTLHVLNIPPWGILVKKLFWSRCYFDGDNMEKSFDISGMHCQSCIGKIKGALQKVEHVLGADVSLSPPKATLKLHSEVPFSVLQKAVSSVGNYELKEVEAKTPEKKPVLSNAEEKKSLYPLFLIVGYILGVVVFAGFNSDNLSISWLMRQFMAGFFITFSFFKLLDLEGFVSAFRGYDLLARRYSAYGWAYPFIELTLGISYLTGMFLVPAYVATILIMGVGAVGVFKVLLNKNSIQCACLGTVLNLPMTKVTLIENTTMVVIAALMLGI